MKTLFGVGVFVILKLEKKTVKIQKHVKVGNINVYDEYGKPLIREETKDIYTYFLNGVEIDIKKLSKENLVQVRGTFLKQVGSISTLSIFTHELMSIPKMISLAETLQKEIYSLYEIEVKLEDIYIT